MAIGSPVAGEAIVANRCLAYPLAMAYEAEEPEIIYIPPQDTSRRSGDPDGPSQRRPKRGGISVGWILAGMAWGSVFQEPLWASAVYGLAFGWVRGLLVRVSRAVWGAWYRAFGHGQSRCWAASCGPRGRSEAACEWGQKGKLAPAEGFEPTASRLTVDRSTTELRGNAWFRHRGACGDILSIQRPPPQRQIRPAAGRGLGHGYFRLDRPSGTAL